MNPRLLLSVTVLLFGIATPTWAEDAQTILKKAITAHGGEKLLSTYRAGTSNVSGEIMTELGKSSFTGKLAYMLPDKYRITLAMEIGGAKITIVQTVNGTATGITVNGMKQPLTEDQKKETLASAALQEIGQLVPLLNHKRFTVTSGESDTVNGQPAHRLIVREKTIGAVDMFFDTKSGLLVKTTRQSLAPSGKKVVEATVLSDYQKLQGVLSPMKLVVTHDGQPFMTMKMTDGKLLEKLDEKEFTITD